MFLPKDRAEEYIRLRNNPSKSMKDLLRFPTYIAIENTADCNAACRMCPFAHNLNRYMADDLFNSIMEQVGENSTSINQIQIQGRGEPLMDPGIAKKIDCASNTHKIISVMSTNASLLSKSVAEDLIDANLGAIVLSVDSLNKEVYEKIRRGLVFEEVMENVHNFINLRNKKSSKTQIKIRMVQQGPNLEEWNEYKEFWTPKLRSTDRLTLKKVHSFGNKLKIKDVRNIKTDLDHFPCHGLWGTFNMMYDGVVQLCPGDSAHLKVIIGNVNDNTIEEIWNGKILSAFRKSHINGTKAPKKECLSCRCWAEPSDFENIGEKLFPELYDAHPEYKHKIELGMRNQAANLNLNPSDRYE